MPRDLVSLGANLAFLDDLYDRYAADRASVDPSFRELFSNGQVPAQARMPAPAAILPRAEPLARPSAVDAEAQAAEAGSVWPLVNAYRARGHLKAELDPLGMIQRPGTRELDPSTYGFSDADLTKRYATGGLFGPKYLTLAELIERLQSIYCGSIGLEFMHISTPIKKAWLAERMETRQSWGTIDAATRKRMLEQLVRAESFERFVHFKYPGTKRFSLEGSEAMIPLLDLTLEHLTRLGAIEAVIGMAHRGRLNVLANIMGRAGEDIFSEFEDIEPEATLGAGDVKYHLGYSCDRRAADGSPLHVSLTFNPSHLEAVDPVVVGRVRAKQRRHADWEHMLVAGILVHGDAAFAGQGLVAETLQLSNLHGFRTGGTVHLIVNNQIGFTASPQESRSTPYCTDLAKGIQCPIFHVNGEDLDALAQVVKMAMEYRAQFQSDVVIDMFCYRKFGHNEMDEPSFTQPLMYKRIQQKTSIVDLYGRVLESDGVIAGGDVEALRHRERDRLDVELERARKTVKRPVIRSMGGVWSGYRGGHDVDVPEVETGVSIERLKAVAERITTVPQGVKVHRKIKRLLAERAAMGNGEQPLDWGMGELLAYGTLLWDGTNVRLTGQDSARGTFSHRHALVTDIETGTEHMLLGHLHPDQGECRIYDSLLSEAGVLGFEFGYSLDYPDALVIWEAQFGDFANGAQVIIDQFIVSCEDKWKRLSGITLFLPHGYEGQGPEHSSARMERFLQLCAEDNIQVVQPTTPAQMFHLLRRQVLRPWRKPLVVLTPKSLLRLPAASSSLDELSHGSFSRVLGDPSPPPAKDVERVLLCSGRIYYDLIAERKKRGDKRTAVIRLEQLYPWRPEPLEEALKAAPNAKEFVWVQDEPANMGAYRFLHFKLNGVLGKKALRLVSRPESASPATGSSKAHAIEQRAILDAAFAD